MDFPQPEGPTSPSTSPLATWSDTPPSASTVPRRVGNFFVKPARDTAGWAGAVLAISDSLSGALTDIVLLAPFAGITPQVRRVSAGSAAMALVRYLSPLCPRAPLEDLRRVYLRACIASSRSAKFSIRTMRPSRNVHTWKNRSSAYAPLMTPRPLPRTAVK